MTKRNKLGPFQRGGDGQWWYVDSRFNKWLDNTTVHGIVHVFKGKSIVKRIFWSFIFLGSLAGCFYNVTERLRHLLSEPTVTNIKVDTRQNGVPFPAVTICNLNPVDITAATSYGVKDIVNVLYGIPAENFFDRCAAALENTSPESKELSLRELLANGQPPLRDFIIECTFGASFAEIDCIDQFKPIITNIGLCYTFNGENATHRIVRVSGERYGLRLVVDINQDRFNSSINGDSGVKIAIDSQGSLPEPDERGIAVPPGTYTYIALKTEKTIDHTGKSGCRRDDEESLQYFPEDNYSQTACKLDAFVQNAANYCDCIDPVAKVVPEGERNCTIDDSCCSVFSHLSFSSAMTSCPVECTKLQYTATTSYSQFPKKSLAQQIAAELDVPIDYLHENWLGVSIYFETITTLVTETSSSYSFSAFLSDLGGQLGLFLGASVISALEIGLFCVDKLKDCMFTKTLKKKVRSFEKHVHVPEVTDEIKQGDMPEIENKSYRELLDIDKRTIKNSQKVIQNQGFRNSL